MELFQTALDLYRLLPPYRHPVMATTTRTFRIALVWSRFCKRCTSCPITITINSVSWNCPPQSARHCARVYCHVVAIASAIMTNPDNDRWQSTPEARIVSGGFDLGYEHYFSNGGSLNLNGFARSRIDDFTRISIDQVNGRWLSKPINDGSATTTALSLMPLPGCALHGRCSRY